MAGKRTSEVAPESVAPTAIELVINVVGNVATATVTADGNAIDAEVQWWPNTPYRKAAGGVAQNIYRDPRTFALSAIRFEPPLQYLATARAKINGEWIYSAAVSAAL